MSNVAKLKKQAAELEAKKQFDKALAVYVKLLENFDENADELDVALFNRVGDLMLRQGNVADAVDYYEKAVDRYADGGFFNNAIALCNKILRHSPGRASVYYKLGKISAHKGFKTDAKQNFLEYADRMQKAGKIDEAFRALNEFADLCPDQDDIRLMLADQLTKLDRKSEAIEQLQTLYSRYESEGRHGEASATVERMKAIDPAVEPRSGGGRQHRSSMDLVFIDLDDSPPPPRSSVATAPTPPRTPTPPRAATPPVAAEPVAASGVDTPLEGITRIADDVLVEKTPSESLLGLESTNLADAGADHRTETPAGGLLDIEPTSLDSLNVPPVHRSSTQTHAAADKRTPIGGDLPLVVPKPEEPAADRPRASIELDLGSVELPPTPPKSTPAIGQPTPHTAAAALEGLPLMDLEVPSPPPVSDQPRRVSRPIEELSLDEDLSIDEPLGGPEVADEEPMIMPTPSIARRSTMFAAQSVEILKASVEGEPENWSLHRELAEAMLDAGDRGGGLVELEAAMSGAERLGDLDLASSIADEFVRIEPDTVKHHQKRVEYAFRTNDKARLIEAYLSLADALHRSDQAEKARSVYQRVLDLAPNDIRAQAALESIVVPEPEPPPPPSRTSRTSRASTARVSTMDTRRSVPAASPPPEMADDGAGPADFVNLGDWLRDDEGPKDTRMIVAEEEPTGDEEADFADMLKKFKQGVAENVDAEDYQSHYDLAIAYKEMGLIDEAIAGFQRALGSPSNRLPTYEALGHCFIEKEQYKMASSILGRALAERDASEEKLLGVLYLLGRAAEGQGNVDEALAYYQRVFVLDIQFRDVAERINDVERAAR
jgi:tetratricopeptide (TPR) repeat protein